MLLKIILIIFLLSTIFLKGEQNMNDQLYNFIDPIAGAYKLLELDNYHTSKPYIDDINLTSTEIQKDIFPHYTIDSFNISNSELWHDISIDVYNKSGYIFNINIYVAISPTEKLMRQQIEAPFLGISGPVTNLYIDKNEFSDYTASLNLKNFFVVSAKSNIVVHTSVNYGFDKIDGMEINQMVLDYIFNK